MCWTKKKHTWSGRHSRKRGTRGPDLSTWPQEGDRHCVRTSSRDRCTRKRTSSAHRRASPQQPCSRRPKHGGGDRSSSSSTALLRLPICGFWKAFDHENGQSALLMHTRRNTQTTLGRTSSSYLQRLQRFSKANVRGGWLSFPSVLPVLSTLPSPFACTKFGV